MNTAEVILVPVLSDNYAYILHKGDQVAVIDPGQPEPLIYELDNRDLTPSVILNTHHHSDHIAGNKALLDKYGARLVAPESERARIPGINKAVKDGTIIEFADETIEVIDTPGHTSGHICYHLPQSKILFAGDLIFAMGCGRAFEGTAEELYASIEKIKALPAETEIYCGHEYTLSNAEFCLTVEPDNDELIARHKEVKQYRDNNLPTIPTTLEKEMQTNVFLRAKSAEEFADIRQKKDNF
ncbi:MAG: hydroxyacylglutathione hydrolase [Alphaproteobacteria bacterium]|nr:hydroxyacylglutathione hydrolase [Alphaproteobacteria bacterium]